MTNCPHCGLIRGHHNSILQGCTCQFQMMGARVSFTKPWVSLTDDEQVAAHAKRLALELECMLLACTCAAGVSWWASANEALAAYQECVDRLYPQDHVSPLGKE